jgi:hypothetical protein
LVKAKTSQRVVQAGGQLLKLPSLWHCPCFNTTRYQCWNALPRLRQSPDSFTSPSISPTMYCSKNDKYPLTFVKKPYASASSKLVKTKATESFLLQLGSLAVTAHGTLTVSLVAYNLFLAALCDSVDSPDTNNADKPSWTQTNP